MDFKTRFQGKTSKITKDGDLDGHKADFDQFKNQPQRGNSIHKSERFGDKQDGLNLTRNSKFSYRGSEAGSI